MIKQNKKTKAFVIPAVQIVQIVTGIVGAIEKIEGIFNSGIFAFLCKKKEAKAKAQILAVLDVIPPELYDEDEKLKGRLMVVREKLAKKK